MKKLFLRKEMSYLFTLLAGLLMYFLTNIINSYKDSPALLYRYESVHSVTVNDNIEEQLICRLENTSSSDMLRDVNVKMQYRTAVHVPEKKIFGLLFNPEIVPVSPASDMEDSIRNDEKFANYYFLQAIQPNCKYLLKAKAVHHNSITEMPKLYITSEYPIRLIGGREAWMVKHIYIIQWVLAGILFVFLILYFIYTSKQE